MAARIAVRLPLHLQRSNAAVLTLTPSPLAALAGGRGGVRHSSTLGSGLSLKRRSSLSYNNRTTFTLADHLNAHHEIMGPAESACQSTQSAEFHTSIQRPFQTHSGTNEHYVSASQSQQEAQPGSIAFGECEISALSDLFLQFAKTKDSVSDGAPYLNLNRIKLLLESVGEKPSEAMLQSLMEEINAHKDGKLRLDCFLAAADRILGEAPARVVLIVGGPGSGKGALCERLARDCGAVHLSCGEMLREEVEAGTPLGKEVAAIMERGDLVSSALVTALMRRRMRQHPGRRILLDGFPRSKENAKDFVKLCGPPELALHLDCDDTVLIERILARGGKSAKDAERAAKEGSPEVAVRADDNVHTAIQRLKNYHKHHHSTMSWLKEIRVPIVELDCSGSKDEVWGQLSAIGRLMRPAVKLPDTVATQQQQQVVNGAGGGMAVNGSQAQNAAAPVNEDMQWIA